MTVYIDVLITMNIYITYFILRASAALLHCRLTFARLAAGSVTGGLVSVCALIPAGIFFSLLLKAALTVLTVLIAFGFGSAGLFIIRSSVCIAVSMLICGAAELIHDITGSSMIFAANGYVYLNVSALILVISSAVIYCALSLVRRLLDSPVTDLPITMTIRNSGRTASISAIADSGNRLRDPVTGLPVIICKREAVEEILPANVLAFFRGNTDNMAGIKLVIMNTASGSGIAAAFRPDMLQVSYNGISRPLDALIGVNEHSLSGEDFDAVIPSKLLR